MFSFLPLRDSLLAKLLSKLTQKPRLSWCFSRSLRAMTCLSSSTGSTPESRPSRHCNSTRSVRFPLSLRLPASPPLSQLLVSILFKPCPRCCPVLLPRPVAQPLVLLTHGTPGVSALFAPTLLLLLSKRIHLPTAGVSLTRARALCRVAIRPESQRPGRSSPAIQQERERAQRPSHRHPRVSAQ